MSGERLFYGEFDRGVFLAWLAGFFVGVVLALRRVNDKLKEVLEKHKNNRP